MTRHIFSRVRHDAGSNFSHFVRQDICQHRAAARQFLRNSAGPIRDGQRLIFRIEKCRDCGAKLTSID
jgi:hypothetical protein